MDIVSKIVIKIENGNQVFINYDAVFINVAAVFVNSVSVYSFYSEMNMNIY